MIAGDWGIARIVLQIIAEQGPGMAYAAAENAETAALAASLGVLRARGTR